MKRILAACLAALTILVLLLPAATAEGIVFSEREKAIRLADRALEEKYGITLLTQEYFDRVTEENEDGGYTVQYSGSDLWGYALGTYEVSVADGAVTGITWSHDGEDTSGGLAAEAWGNEQILEMLRLNQETGDISLFENRVNEINEKHSYIVNRNQAGDSELILRGEQSPETMEQAVLSVEEIDAIAMRAVAEAYELADGQASLMEVLNGTDEKAYWYIMYRDVPCLVSCIGVGDDNAAPDVLPNGLLYTEKNGTYWVCVNVKTGVVEEIVYSAGIGGNG